jgi:hypothetical protein
MRKALIVGIDHYASDRLPSLTGCVNDAIEVNDMMETNADGSPNCEVKLMLGTRKDPVTRAGLKEAIRRLFSIEGELAVLYFAGHGHVEATGGYLLASDSERWDEGVPLADVLALANRLKSTNKVIILDSCNSGIAGADPYPPHHSGLSEGMTILTAATADQGALERQGGGVFTGLLVDGLRGAAANLVGKITPGSVYAHIDQSLGWWGQRPVFKTNVDRFVSLRSVAPAMSLPDLRRILDFFPSEGLEFRLEPCYEPTESCAEKKKTEDFALLQKMNRVNLVVPVDAEHMYFAAVNSKSCRLTPLGEHYRRLVVNKRI